SSRRRHTRSKRDWSSDVCSSDLWVTGTVDGVTGPAAAAAPGSDAAPGLAGLALVGIAAAVATATSGRIGRWIALVALAAVGLGRSEERRVGTEGGTRLARQRGAE